MLKYRVPHGSQGPNFHAAGRKKESGAATPTRWVVGRLYLSILPAGTRDTLTETHTHGFGLIAICGIQRDIRRVIADSYQGHTPSTYRTWLQGIDPQTAGKPAYTSYIGAKVAQLFETGWGVGVVCCIAARALQLCRIN